MAIVKSGVPARNTVVLRNPQCCGLCSTLMLPARADFIPKEFENEGPLMISAALSFVAPDSMPAKGGSFGIQHPMAGGETLGTRFSQRGYIDWSVARPSPLALRHPPRKARRQARD